MKEFPVIASAESPAALRKVLRQEDLVQYDDSFVPEFIYRAIEPEKRFENMRVSTSPAPPYPFNC